MIALSWNYLIAWVIGLFTGISMKKKTHARNQIMQSRIGATHNIGVAGWGLRGPCFPPNF